jgi:hypothetical protein
MGAPAAVTNVRLNAPAADTTAPIVTITSPTSAATYDNGTAASVALAGTASDSGRGLSGDVNWSNTLTGGGGTATGSTNWSATVPVSVGSNPVTVSALDVVGNVGSVLITVSRSSAVTADRFVSTTGSDLNIGSEASPWLTPAKAMATLTAGQTCAMRGGVYAYSSALAPTNSGTQGNPITLMAYPGETPVLDRGFTSANGETANIYATSCFNFDGRNWWTLDGLEIKRGWGAIITYAENANTTGIVVQHCNVHSHVTSDNGAAFFMNGGGSNIAIDCVIHSNLIHDRVVSTRPNTGHGVIMFHSLRAVITHNEIYNVGGGVYFKHCLESSGDAIVRYNIIRNLNAAVTGHPIGHGISWNAGTGTIEHNLIYSMGHSGIQIFEESTDCSGTTTHDNVINHNTIVDVGLQAGEGYGIMLLRSASCAATVRNIITNNVVRTWTGATGSSRGGIVILPFFGSDTSQSTVRNNCVSSAGQTNEAHVVGTNYSIGSLPASVTASGNIDTAPTFVNAASGDYTLAPGSAGKNAALDGTDMGCDMTLVGVQ